MYLLFKLFKLNQMFAAITLSFGSDIMLFLCDVLVMKEIFKILLQVGKGSLISIRLGCNQESSDFLTAYLQRDDNKEVVVSKHFVVST